MSAQLPPIESASPSAPGRRKRVRSALIAFEVARARAIRDVQLAARQAPAGTQEWKVWVKLLQNLRTADPWRT